MEAISRKADPVNLLQSIAQPGMDLISLAENGIQEAISGCTGVVHDMCTHIAQSGGKRIRPQLVLLGGLAFSPFNQTLLQAAVASELIHMASLVHDDILDESNMRRGRSSVNHQWGNHAAVLCGDWLFAKAFAILSDNKLQMSMGYMVEAIQDMCHGELVQAANRYNLEITIDKYNEQIIQKTAKLLECCCKSGAAAGGANQEQIQAMGDFGHSLGMAFQIMDDVLDFLGSPQKMGKPKGEDLQQGLITLPVILLMKDTQFSATAKELIHADNFNQIDVDKVKNLLIISGVMEQVNQMASSYIEQAKNCLNKIPESGGKSCLLSLASSLQQREN